MFKNIFSSIPDNSFIDKTFVDFNHIDSITQFLQSLSYWQKLNLYTSLLMSKSDISFNKAKSQALCNISNEEKLHYLLEETINSPGPKKETAQKSFEKEELKIKDQLIATLLKRIDTLEQSSS